MPATTAALQPHADAGSDRRLWIAYASACLLCWLLYVLAGAEFQRGLWQVWEAVYQATLSLWPPMLLGLAVHPWARWLQRREPPTWAALALHAAGGLTFGLLWLVLDYASALWLFGADHASAVLSQTLLWRAIWGMVVYAAIATGFTAMLQSRRARVAALAAVQAESSLARAELAAITGKLNPHFLFNTLNSLIALTRKDAHAAEAALMRFSGMLRYVLDSKRSAADRVALADEVDFVRDYLALESLRLGPRLQIDWQLDATTLDEEVPPLTLQPLVENSIVHGIAPRVKGGVVRIRSAYQEADGDGRRGLALSIEDDGPGCDPAALERNGDTTDDTARRGIGLAALKRRFALDYGGQARLHIHTAPGAGFRVNIWIPL